MNLDMADVMQSDNLTVIASPGTRMQMMPVGIFGISNDPTA
jgi:hypothetical protein